MVNLNKQSANNFQIVLINPEIPGNTGSIGRTCLALGARLILIGNYGFSLDEKKVRRAGLDYWKYVMLTEFQSWDDFLQVESPRPSHLFFLETGNYPTLFESKLPEGAYFVFGSETKGHSLEITNKYQQSHFYTMPMYSDKIRSINLSNIATACAYEFIRQQHFNFS